MVLKCVAFYIRLNHNHIALLMIMTTMMDWRIISVDQKPCINCVPTVRVVRMTITSMVVDNVGNSVSIRASLLLVIDKQLTAPSYRTECD